MENFEPNKFEQNTHPYTIKRLSPSIGAELLDVDLKKPLTDSLKDEIYQALLVYKVIFFRDQDLTIEEHMDFAKNLSKNVKIPITLWDERLSSEGAFKMTKELNTNVSNKIKNLDKNSAAFILQGAIDYLTN